MPARKWKYRLLRFYIQSVYIEFRFFQSKHLALWTGKQFITVLLNPSSDTKNYVTIEMMEKGYKKGEGMCLNDSW